MEIKPGDTVYVDNLSLSWGYYTGDLKVIGVLPDGHGNTLLNLGSDGYSLVSGINANQVELKEHAGQ